MLSTLFHRVAAPFRAPRRFAGPAGERLYAVGDVHGRLDLVDEMLGLIADDLAARPGPLATIVFLGDLIDRGPQSAGVIERLSTLTRRATRATVLMGNHEEMMLRALAGEPGVAHDWLRFGGDACVESYGLSPAALGAMVEEDIARALDKAVPPSHVAFLWEMTDSYRFGDYLLVHAGIRPGVDLDEQRPRDLRWIRRPFLADRRDHGVMVVHGHTISEEVDLRANRIGIDTGAYRTGVLTAVAIEGEEVRFVATGG